MSGGKSDLCLFPPAAGTSPSPAPNPFPLGSWGIPAKHLEWEGSFKWAGLVSSGGGGGSCSAPCWVPPSLVLPSHPLIYPHSPLEPEDLLFSIIYNLRLGPPVLLH